MTAPTTPYVVRMLAPDLEDPPMRMGQALIGPLTGYCGCCGEYVTRGHHKDDAPVFGRAVLAEAVNR